MNHHHQSTDPTILTIPDMKITHTVIPVQELTTVVYLFRDTKSHKIITDIYLVLLYCVKIDLWGCLVYVHVNYLYKYKPHYL